MDMKYTERIDTQSVKILDAINKLVKKNTKYAVRSSGIKEDLAESIYSAVETNNEVITAIANEYYKKNIIDKLKLDLKCETDPMKQANILSEIMKIRGVKTSD